MPVPGPDNGRVGSGRASGVNPAPGSCADRTLRRGDPAPGADGRPTTTFYFCFLSFEFRLTNNEKEIVTSIFKKSTNKKNLKKSKRVQSKSVQRKKHHCLNIQQDLSWSFLVYLH